MTFERISRHGLEDVFVDTLAEVRSDTLLRVEEAADALRLSRSKTYELIAAGEIRVIKIGRSVRIRRSEIGRFIDSQEKPR